MSRKATIICCIAGGVCFLLGVLFLEIFPTFPYLGVTTLFITIMLFAIVIGTYVQTSIDSMIDSEIAYRKKIDELYEMAKKNEDEKGGAE
jgi:hypothetical protein